MKKILLFIFILIHSSYAFSQDHMPTYYEVLKKFFTSYITSEDYENYTNFAKKKNGWYVQQIDRTNNDSLISEKLFWKNNKYIDLYGSYDERVMDENFEERIEPYLQYDWYNYDHIRYYGYANWYEDMIKDFGNASNLSDTLLDGLGRAYNNNALGYLWYQQGGSNNGKDSLRRKLARLEFPSAQRVEKVKVNLDNSIKQFEKLNILNHNYKTMIGNANLKLFNEYMHAYDQMYRSGDDKSAKEYLQKANPDIRYENQAKNYLNSCDSNAILFTYGDNDTYQLWYVQEKYGFRKDIAVINTSLLALPTYPVLLKKKGIISFAIPEDFLRNEASDATYYKSEKEDESIIDSTLTLRELLDYIYLKKSTFYDVSGIERYCYTTKKVTLPTPSSIDEKLLIDLSNYLYLNDLVMFDIVESNYGKRPIYFTQSYEVYFDDYLVPEGIVYKLKSTTKIPDETTITKNREKYITEKYIPITSDYKSAKKFESYDGDTRCIDMYIDVATHYISIGDMITAKRWTDSLKQYFPEVSTNNIASVRSLGPLFMMTENIALAKKVYETDAQWIYDAYKKPEAIKSFYSKKRCLGRLEIYQNGLEKLGKGSQLIASLLKKLYAEKP
ncbi:hypothetical protein ACQ33O_05350 [Ferruginibacter sp. SUN002]|uniref:hypothetical protein n=1 Tax=Ferruginibacter sp. SUN002 TaxID=2937789 RepID=UPI003D36EE41